MGLFIEHVYDNYNGLFFRHFLFHIALFCLHILRIMIITNAGSFHNLEIPCMVGQWAPHAISSLLDQPCIGSMDTMSRSLENFLGMLTRFFLAS